MEYKERIQEMLNMVNPNESLSMDESTNRHVWDVVIRGHDIVTWNPTTLTFRVWKKKLLEKAVKTENQIDQIIPIEEMLCGACIEELADEVYEVFFKDLMWRWPELPVITVYRSIMKVWPWTRVHGYYQDQYSEPESIDESQMLCWVDCCRPGGRDFWIAHVINDAIINQQGSARK